MLPAAGFADPVQDSAAVFRALLDAMARPGRVYTLPVTPGAPVLLSPAAAAVVMTLVDPTAPLWLSPALAEPSVADWLRFHTGSAPEPAPEAAAFALGRWGTLPVDRLAIGEPEFPDRGTTLLVEVDALMPGEGQALTGPGIDGTHRLAVAGLDAGFWTMLAENRALHPLGRDVILCAGDRIAAIPRTSRLEG